MWSKKPKKDGFGGICSGKPGDRVGFRSGLSQKLGESWQGADWNSEGESPRRGYGEGTQRQGINTWGIGISRQCVGKAIKGRRPRREDRGCWKLGGGLSRVRWPQMDQAGTARGRCRGEDPGPSKLGGAETSCCGGGWAAIG